MLLKFLLKRELDNAKKNGLYDKLKKGAEKYNLSLAYVLAIASRETNIRYMSGDGGHGKGVIQIDDRSHKIAQGDYWITHPQEMIDYGCDMLFGLQKWAKGKWPTFNQYQIEKVAASAFNLGQHLTVQGVIRGDSDTYTTGRNYGRDVLARKAVFVELLSKNV